ncbi:MAG: AAA family ATPase [Planctomycetia bacterium]|nr:AAA family ATPase [Planctomycetia bacterium]
MPIIQHTFQELTSQLDAGIPIVFIQHFDFENVDCYLSRLQNKMGAKVGEYRFGHEVHFKTKIPCDKDGQTDLVDFLRRFNTDCSDPDTPIILVLKEVNPLLSDPAVTAQIRMIAERTMRIVVGTEKGAKTFIILVSDEMNIPRELEHLVRAVQIAPPSDETIKNMILRFFEKYGTRPLEEQLEELTLALHGLSELEINQILRLACARYGFNYEKIQQTVADEKEQVILKSKLLKAISERKRPEDSERKPAESIGGLEVLKEYLERKRKVFSHLTQAEKWHVDVPKGILIVGMPGCGKSLAAKVAALMFGLPLIQMDIGMLLGKYVGESEANFRRAIRLAEAVAPCVLWIDEIEKAFAGLQTEGNQGGANEVTTRLFGSFLTWMQEKTAPVYVIATSNSVNLPSEFYRKGRFDEVFAVYLPNEEERKKILEIHLRKRRYSLPKATLDEAARKTEGACGADLEGIVKEAVEETFLQAIGQNSARQNEISHDIFMEKIRPDHFIQKALGEKYEKMKKTLDGFKLRPASKN